MSYEVRRIRPVGRIRVGSGWEKEPGRLASAVAGDQGVVTAVEHDTGVILDEWKGVSVEITEHGVATPTTYDANFIRIHASKQEGHGAASAEGASGNVGRVDTGMARDGEGSRSKEARDHGGGDRTTLAGVVVVGVEGCGGRSLMVIEVDGPACDSTHGAGGWLSVSGMCQLFAFDSVLLCGESEGGEGCSQ